MFSAVAPATELWLNVGEVKAVAAATSAKVRVGARGIIRVVDGQKVIRLIGLKPGSTSLVVDEKAFTVHVGSGQTAAFVRELRETLANMMGLNLAIQGGTPVIDGTLLRWADWQELAEISRRFDGDWQFRAQALPDVAEAALAYFQNLAHENGYPILQFRATPRFTAQLPQAAHGLKVAVERRLKPFGIRVDMSESTLALEPLVRTHVILAEVERSFSRQFGIAWPTQYQAQLLPGLTGQDALMVTLKALEQDGHAQVLAAPDLLCRSGAEAQFHAGGEMPIRISNRHTDNVLWKSHGVILKVKPRADFQGAISLELETEISMLDTAHSVDGIPALKINHVSSHLDLPGRRTVALSGLLRQDSGRASEGLPGLSQIPILGALFASKNYQKHRSELIVFVTPEIRTPVSDEPMRFPEGWVADEH